jgi:hypothetical protein
MEPFNQCINMGYDYLILCQSKSHQTDSLNRTSYLICFYYFEIKKHTEFISAKDDHKGHRLNYYSKNLFLSLHRQPNRPTFLSV